MVEILGTLTGWLFVVAIGLFILAGVLWFLSQVMDILFDVVKFFYNIYAFIFRKPLLKLGDDYSDHSGRYSENDDDESYYEGDDEFIEVVDKEDLVYRTITFTYKSGDDYTYRTVDVEKAEKWRFSGYCELRGGNRTFSYNNIVGMPICVDTGAKLEIVDGLWDEFED